MEEISLKTLFTILKRGIALAIILGISGTGVAFLLTQHFMADKYSTSIKFHASANFGGIPTLSEEMVALQFSQKAVFSYIQLLKSDTFYNNVMEDMQSDISPTALGNALSFSTLNNTEVIMVSIVTGSAELTMEIANSVLKMAPRMVSSIYSRSAIGVLDEPKYPTSPFFPSLSFNLVCGFVAGVFIALAYMVIKSILMDAPMDEDAFIKKHAIPVLALVPSQDTPFQSWRSFLHKTIVIKWR